MNFLEELQSSSEQRKRRWAVFFSIIAVTIVFVLWRMYFTSLLGGVSVDSLGENGGTAFSFASIGGATAVLRDGIVNFFGVIGNAVWEPRSYAITPSR